MESAPAVPNRTPEATISGNRRRGNRHRLNIPATLVVAGGSPIEVTVTELSVGGVGFQSRTMLKLESVYQVNSFDTLIPPGMKLRIVSQRAVGEAGFEVGAKAI